MSFADNLLHIMAARGMRQADLQRAAGLPVGSVGTYINRGSVPRSYNLQKICAALDCEPQDLLGSDPPRHIRRWPPNRQTCEAQLKSHLGSTIGPQTPDLPTQEESMAVLSRMLAHKDKPADAHQSEFQAADGILSPPPAFLYLSDLQALFDACVDDNDPAVIFAQFGKEVYQLMVENRKENK